MWWRRLRYLLLLVVLCAIATCPAAKRSCTAKARAREADELLEYIADRVAAHVATTGRVPATAAGPTPQPGCCEQGGVCHPDATAWMTEGWRALGFSIDGEHRFSYQYTPAQSGLAATLRAVGDVECAETPAAIELELTVVGGKLSRVWSRKPARE
jgi:hypothetical protein